MNEKRNSSHPSGGGGMALADIYFVLFRNKWKITILSTLGFVAAAGIYLFKPPTYQSEADLFIKYVRSDRPVMASAADAQMQTLDSGVDGVISAELSILSSFDLAYQVATNIGPAKILGMTGAANDAALANAAANRIRENLTVEHTPRTPLLRIVFVHSDLGLVQPILQQLIDDYQLRHKQIHSANGVSYDTLVEQVRGIHDEMSQTEELLHKAKNAANVNNIDKKKDENEQTLSQLHMGIMSVSAELAEHKSRLAKLTPANKPPTSTMLTNNVTTNVQAAIPKEKTEHYQQTLDLISDLRKEYINLRSIYPLRNKLVVEKQAQIDEQNKIKKGLEQDEPRLVDYKDTSDKSPGSSTSISSATSDQSFQQEQAAVDSLQAKLDYLKKSYDEVHADSVNLDAREFNIHELEHKLKEQQSHYDYFDNALETMKIDTQVGAVKDANISVTQSPTPPARELHKTPKMMGVVAGGGIVLGLAWAFLLELYFDHSVKRAKDIETELGMRLFLSIPDTRRNGHRRKAKAALKETALAKVTTEDGAAVPPANGSNGEGPLEIAPWDYNHSLHQYYEALRDRLISYFEVNNLNHKPKLVAVTGSSKGSGTTTIAAGLAASLSETGDGNVLLIDMNLEKGAAQHFYKGKPNCELETALEGGTMEKAMIQDNLYVVAGRTNNGDKLSSMLPKRFANLIPKLKASDYDYIIFDMPPISRTGVTQRLAGFMDMMMLVVEAEKTNRDVVRQANALLTESKAKVSVVLNKTRTYVPARLHQEF